MGINLLDAVEALHTHGLLHRDIKPSNIAYDGRGSFKLLDFGLASLLDVSTGSPCDFKPKGAKLRLSGGQERTGHTILSQDNRLVGTPLYLCPEAVEGHPPDPGFDLWALNMVLFETLVGCHPWSGKSVPAVLLLITSIGLPSLSENRRELPTSLIRYFERALSGTREDRPQDAKAAARALKIAFDSCLEDC